MSNKKQYKSNFSKLAQELTEKDKFKSTPYAAKKQDERKHKFDSYRPSAPAAQKNTAIKPPQQMNRLEEKVLQHPKVSKKENTKRVMYKPQMSVVQNKCARNGNIETNAYVGSSNHPNGAWDEEIKLNTRMIPEVEDFIAFENSNQSINFVAAEEVTEVFSTPWFDPNSFSRNLTPTDRLQQEVSSFIEYLSPTPAEVKVREWLCRQVEKVVQLHYPNANVVIFGSFSTGLYLPTSDVDLLVQIPALPDSEVVQALKKISSSLRRKMDVVGCEVRAKAKVPIINFRETQTELDVDISINVDGGIHSRTIVLSFMEQCPAIRPLIMILKHFLELKGLNVVFNGGLGSYATTLLVISFMQIHPKIRTGEIDPSENLGVLLVEFFELYGPSLNPNNVGISLANGGRYYKKIHKPSNQTRVSPLELLDPQDETNNVARSSHGFPNAQTAFKGAFATLTQNLLKYNRHLEQNRGKLYSESILGSILNVPQSTILRRLNHEKIWRSLTKDI